ncbi:MAG: helix-turn-helix transcriptional regulator [Saprospiraceae bacterium]|nr:helix-turn-helix transcriptional regulator [Lewinellaceae bacterium]MBP6810918.1 helix-turn-helix transcriptional regulator [Saprospiraceae bacterium]
MQTESIEDFYRSKLNWMPDNLKKEIGHFNVFRLDDFTGSQAKPMPYSRKDYFKVSFIIGRNRAHYADKVVENDGFTLLFANPKIPYKWEPLDQAQSGYFCIFTEAFFSQFASIKEYPVFQPGGNPIFQLTEEQVGPVRNIFLKMFEEIDSDYTYKYDVLRTLVLEIVHSAQKMQPAEISLYGASNAATRISSLFMELLERQFPIESPRQQIAFRSPVAFAAQLSVHVNHLNRALKEITGKTTSQVIAERVSQEARALLKHTNWNIGEIAWCLGFEELSHFINFFKKQVEVSPKSFRDLKPV